MNMPVGSYVNDIANQMKLNLDKKLKYPDSHKDAREYWLLAYMRLGKKGETLRQLDPSTSANRLRTYYLVKQPFHDTR